MSGEPKQVIALTKPGICVDECLCVSACGYIRVTARDFFLFFFMYESARAYVSGQVKHVIIYSYSSYYLRATRVRETWNSRPQDSSLFPVFTTRPKKKMREKKIGGNKIGDRRE